MRELVRSALPRDWEINGQRVLIPPPTIRDALEVLATNEGYRDNADADTDVFQDAVRRWLPSIVVDEILSDDADRGVVTTLVLGLILEGVEPPSEKKRSKVIAAMRRPYMHMLGAYCRVFHLDPWLVYTKTPWPFFLVFLKESHRQSAINELGRMRTSLASNMKGDAIRKMGNDLKHQLDLVELSGEEKELADIEASEDGIEILEAMKLEQNAKFRTN